MKWFHLFLMKPISRLVGFMFAKKGIHFSVGMLLHSFSNFLVNILLAGYLAFHLNLLGSFICLFLATILKVILMVKLYDCFGQDVFGLEKAKNGEVKNKIVHKIENILRKFSNKSRFLTFVTLILVDHFFGVIYMRKSHHAYRGIPKEDWGAIVTALLIATTVLVVGWEIVEFLWKIFMCLMS